MAEDAGGAAVDSGLQASPERASLPARQAVFVGVTLFSMFFGAGNLILPPLLGVQAGRDSLPAILGFFVAGVGLPVLGIVAVALSGTLRELASRVHPLFARIFVALVYLAIGPCLAIPRTASTAFEMLAPLLPEGLSLEVARLVFSVAFFAVAYVLAMRPGRLTRLLGRVTGPAPRLPEPRRCPMLLPWRPTTQAPPFRAFSRDTRPWTFSLRSRLVW